MWSSHNNSIILYNHFFMVYFLWLSDWIIDFSDDDEFTMSYISIKFRSSAFISVERASWKTSLLPSSLLEMKTVTVMNPKSWLATILLSRIDKPKVLMNCFLAYRVSSQTKVEELQILGPKLPNTWGLNPDLYICFHGLMIFEKTLKPKQSIRVLFVSLQSPIDWLYQLYICKWKVIILQLDFLPVKVTLLSQVKRNKMLHKLWKAIYKVILLLILLRFLLLKFEFWEILNPYWLLNFVPHILSQVTRSNNYS